MSTSNLVLRTVYLSPTVDDKLRVKAFDDRTSKNDLIRKYIELGMRAEEGGLELVVKRPASAKKLHVAKRTAKKASAKKRSNSRKRLISAAASSMSKSSV